MRNPWVQRLIRYSLAIFNTLALLVVGSEMGLSREKAGRESSPQGRDQSVAGLIDLSGTWKMKEFARGVGVQKQAYLPSQEPKDCIPAPVPGTVRTALLGAGRIPDPYNGYDNEKSLWIEDREWWFYRDFFVPAQAKGAWVDVVLEGSVFAGDVWINGRHVGVLHGMLNPRSFDVSGVLQYGQSNTIAVRLEAPPDTRMNVTERGLTWRTPRDQLYSIAQCVYGWDWGPHMVPVGLWRPVMLRVSGPLRLDHPYVRTRIPSDSEAVCSVSIDARNLDNASREATITGSIRDQISGKDVGLFRKVVAIGPGKTSTGDFTVTIQKPRLWWPNGMGEQYMYELRASVSEGGVESENLTTTFGIRELKLVDNDMIEESLKPMKGELGDPHHLGKAAGSYPWTFEVNGVKMFAKGGNWIPADAMLRLDHSRYDRLLKLAKDAHFNLLRVWGGGLYETDDFYNLCDRYGILAWQEFLSNRNFSRIDRSSFLDGARSAVFRLRNHPSLTFWCGGNEFDPDDKGSKEVIDSLGVLLKGLDPEREFHRASPYKGDDHYWGVWHGREPYTNYRVLRPFRSEAGINAFPVPEDYLRFTPDSLRWPPDTTFIEYHGESNVRFQHLAKLMRYADEFGPSTGIGDLIMKSELYQALANEFDMEYCRSNKFRNSGFLVWQYNDIWPSVSWSIVDWYGIPKPSYYFMKRASRPVHISADYERYLWKPGETFTSTIYLLNGTQEQLAGGNFAASLVDVNGRMLGTTSGMAEGNANSSTEIGKIAFPIPGSMAGKTFFVSVRLAGKSGNTVSDALYPIAVSATGNVSDFDGIFEDLKNLPSVHLRIRAPQQGVNWEGETGACSFMISNPSDGIAFFIRVRLVEESDAVRSSYSDNYITLMPGESKSIEASLDRGQAKAGSMPVHFEVSGWNCPAQTIEFH